MASGATGNQLNVTDNIQALLRRSIDLRHRDALNRSGAITLHGDDSTNLSISSSNPAAFAALGFQRAGIATPGAAASTVRRFATAGNLIGGTPANTVSWYTGENGPVPARGTAIARVDQSVTVQWCACQ